MTALNSKADSGHGKQSIDRTAQKADTVQQKNALDRTAQKGDTGQGKNIQDSIAQKSGARDRYENGYLGGKGQDGVFQTIINEIPACEDYWELFAGNASIYRRFTNKPNRCFLVEKSYKQAYWLGNHLRVACYSLDFVRCNVLNKSMFQEGTYVVWGSAFEIFELVRTEYLDKPDSYFFVDPPYMMETHTSSLRYDHELTDEEHRTLLTHLLSFKQAKVGICTYPNPTYNAMLQQWRLKEYKAVTRGGTVRTEQFWMNYQVPDRLQDTHYIGKDYREREAYRKQQKNWLKNFKAMHPHQQQEVLRQLNQSYQP